MMIGKIRSNLILSIRLKNFYCAREYVEDAVPSDSSVGSPTV